MCNIFYEMSVHGLRGFGDAQLVYRSAANLSPKICRRKLVKLTNLVNHDGTESTGPVPERAPADAANEQQT